MGIIDVAKLRDEIAQYPGTTLSPKEEAYYGLFTISGDIFTAPHGTFVMRPGWAEWIAAEYKLTLKRSDTRGAVSWLWWQANSLSLDALGPGPWEKFKEADAPPHFNAEVLVPARPGRRTWARHDKYGVAIPMERSGW